MTEPKVKEITYATATHPTHRDWEVLQVVYKYEDPVAVGRYADYFTLARAGDGSILRRTDPGLDRWELILNGEDLLFFRSLFEKRDKLKLDEATKAGGNMELKNFRVTRLGGNALEEAKKAWADDKFIPSERNEYWLVNFELNGVPHQAGVRRGRRADVAEDVDQLDVQLRVNEESFDADRFLSKLEASDIVAAVSAEFGKGEYWRAPSAAGSPAQG